MTTTTVTTLSTGPASVPMLADVLVRIDADASLPPLKRRDIVSAVRTVARALGSDPTLLPANPTLLRARLRTVHPLAVGLTPKRWANVRADLGFALSHLSLRPEPYLAPLSGEWERLLARLSDARLRWGLSRLARFCSGRQIPPERVDDRVIRELEAALEEESLLRDPGTTVRLAVNAWNRAMHLVPNWPGETLSPLPSRKVAYALPLEAFPISFRADFEAWLSILRGDDPLADEALARPLRPTTLKHRRHQMLRFASALVHRGIPIEELRSLGDLVTTERFKLALRFFLARTGQRRTEAISLLARSVKHMAKHHARVPDDELKTLDTICRRIAVRERGLTAKNRARLRQLDDEAKVRALLTFTARQVRHARQMPVDRRSALLVQIALAVELLLMAPIRLRNLATLDLTRHIQRARGPRRGDAHLVIPAGESKNGQAIEFELPPDLVRLLELYLEVYRPRLLDGPNPHLFPGERGRPKHQQVLATQIQRHVRRATGITVTPHLFRHIGAKLYLDANPGAYEVVRRVLGHTTIDTTTAHYTGFETRAAARHYDETILALRRRAQLTVATRSHLKRSGGWR